MKRSDHWVRLERAQPFLEAAMEVLNGKAFVIPITAPCALTSKNLTEVAEDIISDPRFEASLARAAQDYDPTNGDLSTSYTPPPYVSVSPMSERGARIRLESMLLPSGRYRNFYDRGKSPTEASSLVTSFFNAFEPKPTLFAELGTEFLDGWRWIERGDVDAFVDGFHDSAMLLGAGEFVALLVNNGQD